MTRFMRTPFCYILFLILLVCYSPAHSTEFLSKDKIKKVYASTFEVLVKKIDDGEVTYEKPLPMERVPFHIRNDKYWSLGTAFAIDKNTLVTAAHVFQVIRRSQYNEYFVRDTKGKVYEIGSVGKYSGKKDFIVFKLKDHKLKSYLKTNKNLELNEKVFSVGNALGEGVIIRDGLYTSNTPEQESGEWQWMRFSAAASPGNSGGPLLDAKGNVVGVVLRKSQNENLNYALPINEVLSAPKNIALDEARIMYVVDNMEFKKTDKFTFKTNLPLSLIQLSEKLVAAYSTFTENLSIQVKQENDKEIFPNGEGARDLLHRTYAAEFPHIVWQKSDKTWAPYLPSDIRKSNLGSNGYLQAGNLRNTTLLKIRKPDDIARSNFIQDGKLMMDMVLKVLPVTRDIGGEKIRITSIGNPVKNELYQDRYERKWHIRMWNIPHDDSSIVVLSLPTPNGSVSMLRASATGRIDEHLADLKTMADFLYMSYYGTLSQWDSFLAQKDLLPAALRNVTLRYKTGKKLEFRSNQVSFEYDTKLMNITDTSDIFLNMSYIQQKEGVTWDITRVAVGEETTNGRYFDVAMNIKPSEKMNDADKSFWKKLANREFPYNGESYFKDKSTRIATLYTQNISSEQVQSQPTLYSVSYSIDGKLKQEEVSEKLNSFMETLKIHSLK